MPYGSARRIQYQVDLQGVETEVCSVEGGGHSDYLTLALVWYADTFI